MGVVGDFHGNNPNLIFPCKFENPGQAAFTVALERVRIRTWLERTTAKRVGTSSFDFLGRVYDLVLVLHTTGAGDDRL